MPSHLKRERIEHDLTAEEKHCDSCDEDLRPIGEETSERYEYIPAQMLVIEDVCKKYRLRLHGEDGEQTAATDREERGRCVVIGAGDCQ